MVIKTGGTQKEQSVIEVAKKQPVLLHYDLEYDTTDPEGKLREFVSDIRKMLTKYESNKTRIFEIEAEINDLEHYMEIGKNYKNVHEGYRLYRKLAELRRERRSCKSENDLLEPVYNYFHATEILNKLSWVQGETARVRETIDQRVYGVRTDALNEWLKEEEKEPVISKADKDRIDNILLDFDCDLKKVETENKYELVWKEWSDYGK